MEEIGEVDKVKPNLHQFKRFRSPELPHQMPTNKNEKVYTQVCMRYVWSIHGRAQPPARIQYDSMHKSIDGAPASTRTSHTTYMNPSQEPRRTKKTKRHIHTKKKRREKIL